ncbi:MAG: helix-turn-helix transcriptional regulator [Candidatus Binatia bacterium]|jgi:transcriptional regulator with XRE-family HTH domain
MVSSYVRRLREHCGLSQHGFADLLGCHPLTVSYWENDRAWPQERFRDRMAELAKKYHFDY